MFLFNKEAGLEVDQQWVRSERGWFTMIKIPTWQAIDILDTFDAMKEGDDPDIFSELLKDIVQFDGEVIKIGRPKTEDGTTAIPLWVSNVNFGEHN